MAKKKSEKTPSETKDKNHLVKPKNYDEAAERDLDRLLGRGAQLSAEELRRIYGNQKNG